LPPACEFQFLQGQEAFFFSPSLSDSVILLGFLPLQVDSANKYGTLLEVVQVLTDLKLAIKRAYITSDGEWFMDGEWVVALSLQPPSLLSLESLAKMRGLSGMMQCSKAGLLLGL
jgi:hypothetical protein